MCRTSLFVTINLRNFHIIHFSDGILNILSNLYYNTVCVTRIILELESGTECLDQTLTGYTIYSLGSTECHWGRFA